MFMDDVTCYMRVDLEKKAGAEVDSAMEMDVGTSGIGLVPEPFMEEK